MKGYKSIFDYDISEHGLHENSFYISNMHWIKFIPNQSFMNILHGYKLLRLPYRSKMIMEKERWTITNNFKARIDGQ